MGLYTKIIDKDGEEIQIKVGEDNLETYNIGDTVPWEIGDEAGTGNFIDGVYFGYGKRLENGVFEEKAVIIKDHKIHDVVPINHSYEYLLEHYEIKSYDRSWWGEEAWFQKELKDVERDYELAKDLLEHKKSLISLTPEQREKKKYELAAKYMSDYLIESMQRESLLRRVFSTKEVSNS